MFIYIDDSDPTPVYRQIVNCVRDEIAKGELRPTTPLPSVRELARYLDVNVNTTNRAYQVLKEMGIIRIRPARGAVVAEKALDLLGSKQGEFTLRLQAKKLLEEARRLGFNKDEVLEIINAIEG